MATSWLATARIRFYSVEVKKIIQFAWASWLCSQHLAFHDTPPAAERAAERGWSCNGRSATTRTGCCDGKGLVTHLTPFCAEKHLRFLWTSRQSVGDVMWKIAPSPRICCQCNKHNTVRQHSITAISLHSYDRRTKVFQGKKCAHFLRLRDSIWRQISQQNIFSQLLVVFSSNDRRKDTTHCCLLTSGVRIIATSARFFRIRFTCATDLTQHDHDYHCFMLKQ